ncbi:hypothetical protein C9374_005930 [Naegleria lovaniensis]|uniref:ABC transporter domain-containing protein n=1 Tax=Naegleria lovaniensis TaxID=51637 RepID=A0AA88KMK1_NAELO|nr:uncharacterized protein C9374_005930 [Naegleria lovaniensis]KAG2381546.1 hypothetical protein C9374_005930 [Naegleria lovaniensis]
MTFRMEGASSQLSLASTNGTADLSDSTNHLVPQNPYHHQHETSTIFEASRSSSIEDIASITKHTTTEALDPIGVYATNHPAQFFDQQCFLEWKDLKFPSQSENPILKNVSGFAVPGKITAICGPVGSGKSTLLRILSNRGAYKDYSGDIFINSQLAMNRELQTDRDISNKYKSLVSFVSKDYAPSNMSLTVKEILRFAVRFKLPVRSKNPLWTTRDERLSILLNAYGLKNKENSTFNTLSSGEKRRLCIAAQNVLFHRVVLLEYPTDGIEFGESFHLLRQMKTLAEMGVCVVICLHRPSILELELIDYVSILNKGSTIYFGKPKMIQEYFELIGVQLPLNRQNVVASVFELIILHEMSKSRNEREQQMALHYLDLDKESIERRDHLEAEFEKRKRTFYIPQKEHEEAPFRHNKIEDIQTEKYYSNYFASVWILLERIYLVKLRNWKTEFITPFFEKFIVAVFIGLLYFQISPTNMSLRGKIFSFLNLNISITFGLSIKTLISQIPLMTQERNSTSYRIGAFFLAKSIEDIVDFTIYPFIFGIIIYLLVGFSYEAERVFAFILIFAIYNLTCMSFAQTLVAIIPVPSILNFIAPVINLIFLLVSGAYGLTNTQFLGWIGYASYLSYAFKALAINEFHGVLLQIGNSTTVDNNSTVASTEQPSLPAGHYTNGTLFLERAYGLTDPHYMMWVYLGVLIVYFGVCKVIAYFGLRYIYKGMSVKKVLLKIVHDWCGCCFAKRKIN